MENESVVENENAVEDENCVLCYYKNTDEESAYLLERVNNFYNNASHYELCSSDKPFYTPTVDAINSSGQNSKRKEDKKNGTYNAIKEEGNEDDNAIEYKNKSISNSGKDKNDILSSVKQEVQDVIKFGSKEAETVDVAKDVEKFFGNTFLTDKKVENEKTYKTDKELHENNKMNNNVKINKYVANEDKVI